MIRCSKRLKEILKTATEEPVEIATGGMSLLEKWNAMRVLIGKRPRKQFRNGNEEEWLEDFDNLEHVVQVESQSKLMLTHDNSGNIWICKPSWAAELGFDSYGGDDI